MDWLTSTFAPTPNVTFRDRQDNDDEDDPVPATTEIQSAPITLPTMGQLNDIMNRYSSSFELRSVRPSDLDTDRPDAIAVDPRPDRSIPIPNVDPNAELQTVQVDLWLTLWLALRLALLLTL